MTEISPQPQPEASPPPADIASAAANQARSGTIFDYPQFWQWLDRLTDKGLPIVGERGKQERSTAARATYGTLVLTALVVLLIVAPVTWLTFENKMSADAATFLYGVLAGTVFAFLCDFFPKT
ncbi:MAG: hypothetical protein ACYC3S_16405 [Chloroflexota bacterium]